MELLCGIFFFRQSFLSETIFPVKNLNSFKISCIPCHYLSVLPGTGVLNNLLPSVNTAEGRLYSSWNIKTVYMKKIRDESLFGQEFIFVFISCNTGRFLRRG
ncbi:hypothetical protein MmTuc01_3040 [Methanosarcina mazei Tuc01]|uniref:Uncharacterized protein n=1 Tax=Methanosarcina mazei Tuc01 TaxID=1236903 RepID=M1QMP7_METMZ|nr:hypothetical protein MmTuc01_3040 [Methanosarcina mazei Tuc01]